MAIRAHRQQRNGSPANITGAMPCDRAPASSSDNDNRQTVVRPLRRAPRQSTNTPVEIVSATGSRHSMTMVDVSETGIGLADTVGLAKSEEVEVHMPDGHRLRAVVRWVRSGRAGLQIIGAKDVAGQDRQVTEQAPEVRRTGWHGWWLSHHDEQALRTAPSSLHRWWFRLVARERPASPRQFERAYRENGLAMLLADDEN